MADRWDKGSLADDISKLIHGMDAWQHEAVRGLCDRVWNLERDRDTWKANAKGAGDAAQRMAARAERERDEAQARIAALEAEILDLAQLIGDQLGEQFQAEVLSDTNLSR